jgi:hypothetical protein
MLTYPLKYSKIIFDNGDTDFLLLIKAQSRFRKLNRFSVVNRNVPFYFKGECDMRIKRKNLSRKQRMVAISILKLKYGLRCWYCGVELQVEDVCLDHIIPYRDTKHNDIENLSIACKFCNSHKYYFSVKEFLKYLAYIRSGAFFCPILNSTDTSDLEPTAKDKLQKSYY